ncbi:hypothetical protein JCM11641_005425 [Rhodosporidiobolus odoratus]
MRLLPSLLLAASSALALSSHSPRDLEAHPAFNVRFSEHQILNETLEGLLAEPLETPPDASAPKRHLLRTPGGQAFLCTVPSVTDEVKKRADDEADRDQLARVEERERGLERGVALLEPMKQGCLYQRMGWFTYSFCYGNEIRQYHEVRVAGSPTPIEDPQSDSYTLGVSPEPAALAVPKYGSGSPSLARQNAQIPSRLGGGETAGWDDGGRYLSQTWEGGTVCDKTGLPRVVEVQYHCSTQTIDRIAMIREASICHYIMLIHTPRLCGEPLFLEGQSKHREPASTIECQPVVRKVRELLPEGSGDAPSTRPEETGTHSAETVEAPPPHPASPPPLNDDEAANSPPPPSPEETPRTADSPDQAEESDDVQVTLVFDPETGEIESAVTDLGEDLFVDSELKKQLFGTGDDANERGQGLRAGVEGDGETTVQMLEELAKMMHDTLAEALRSHVNPPADGFEGNVGEADAPARNQPVIIHANDAGIDFGDDPIQKLLRAIKHAASTSSSVVGGEAPGDNKLESGLRKYLDSFKRKKETVQVPRAAIIGNEAHEKLKRGFERRHEEEEGKGAEKPKTRHDEL